MLWRLLNLPDRREMPLHFTAEGYHGWGDADCERFDRNNGSVSLFKRAEVGLARSRIYPSKATRKSMACSPPRTAEYLSWFHRRGSGSHRTFLDLPTGIFHSGHSHQFPYSAGSSWAQRIGGVNVLVPGQILSVPFPNHIVFNTASGEASWETSSQEWISEDAIYLRTVSSITDSDLIRPP
jgi:hypothetical protein